MLQGVDLLQIAITHLTRFRSLIDGAHTLLMICVLRGRVPQRMSALSIGTIIVIDITVRKVFPPVTMAWMFLQNIGRLDAVKVRQ